MKEMAHPCVEKMKQLLNWGKIFLPHSRMRFFPPQFTLRDPIAEGITHAFKDGFEVAVIVFNIKNLHDIHGQLGQLHYKKFINRLKFIFKYSVDRHFEKDEIVALHDYYSDGLTLYVRVNQKRDCLSEIDIIMKKISDEVEKNILIEYPTVPIYFDTGYMFVEKKHYSIHEAIYKAHQQSVAMAEKRVQSEFNEMLFSISKIVSQKDIKLLAQPIIDVESREIKAWEMLTRGPKGTDLESPLQLFSVARQTGKLYELELIVLEKTLEQIQQSGSFHDFFINFTPLTLGNGRFVRDVKKLLLKYKSIPPSQITIEVTERDSIETIKDFVYNIKVLRTMGFRIAVDDTGAGYASLNTISEIMPDIIKIDRSVIQNIDKNTVKESMLKGLLLVAKETGSLVVAEGIESAEEALVLSRNKVDLAQGYFYARPKVLPKLASMS
ncbi:EAL domain-containing protein [Bacillus sp. CGMCC 1.16607]|uniref:EAL domain-containing protein n=1 Tax=Bacillus sp. CGMCC 1.16607 TaxID=3351842 RepID=UPI003631C0B7